MKKIILTLTVSATMLVSAPLASADFGGSTTGCLNASKVYTTPAGQLAVIQDIIPAGCGVSG